jgi:hypothetical protein
VTFNDVESAYQSIDFFTFKAEVEALILGGVTSSALSDDLRCPLPLEPSNVDKFNLALREARERKVAAAALDASLNSAERKATELIKKISNRTESAGGLSKSPAPRKSKRIERTAASIKEAGERFRKSF